MVLRYLAVWPYVPEFGHGDIPHLVKKRGGGYWNLLLEEGKNRRRPFALVGYVHRPLEPEQATAS